MSKLTPVQKRRLWDLFCRASRGEAGTNKELRWKWLDKLAFWWITRNLIHKTDMDMLNQITSNRSKKVAPKPTDKGLEK